MSRLLQNNAPSAPPDDGTAITVAQQKLSPSLQAYVMALAQRSPFTNDLKLDRRNVLSALERFWPRLPEWDAQAHELWRQIDRIVQAIPALDTRSEVFLRVSAAVSRAGPNALPEPMGAAVVATFDGVDGVLRQYTVPGLEIPHELIDMTIPAGVIVVGQALSPLFNVYDDNRPHDIGAGAVYGATRTRDRILTADQEAEEAEAQMPMFPPPSASLHHERQHHTYLHLRSLKEGMENDTDEGGARTSSETARHVAMIAAAYAVSEEARKMGVAATKQTEQAALTNQTLSVETAAEVAELAHEVTIAEAEVTATGEIEPHRSGRPLRPEPDGGIHRHGVDEDPHAEPAHQPLPVQARQANRTPLPPTGAAVAHDNVGSPVVGGIALGVAAGLPHTGPVAPPVGGVHVIHRVAESVATGSPLPQVKNTGTQPAATAKHPESPHPSEPAATPPKQEGTVSTVAEKREPLTAEETRVESAASPTGAYGSGPHEGPDAALRAEHESRMATEREQENYTHMNARSETRGLRPQESGNDASSYENDSFERGYHRWPQARLGPVGVVSGVAASSYVYHHATLFPLHEWAGHIRSAVAHGLGFAAVYPDMTLAMGANSAAYSPAWVVASHAALTGQPSRAYAFDGQALPVGTTGPAAKAAVHPKVVAPHMTIAPVSLPSHFNPTLSVGPMALIGALLKDKIKTEKIEMQQAQQPELEMNIAPPQAAEEPTPEP